MRLGYLTHLVMVWHHFLSSPLSAKPQPFPPSRSSAPSVPFTSLSHHPLYHTPSAFLYSYLALPCSPACGLIPRTRGLHWHAHSRDSITIFHAAPSDSPTHSHLFSSILFCIYSSDVHATSPARAVDVRSRAPFVLSRPRLRSPRSLLCHSTTPRLVPHTRSHTHSHSSQSP